MGILHSKPKRPAINIGLDVNLLLVTSYAQKLLAQAFKYSIDDKYPIKSKNEDDSYMPVRTYKNIRTDEKQELELSISISRRVSIYNTEPYHDYFLDVRDLAFNIIVLMYDSSTISPEDFSMALKHLKAHIDTYNPEKIIAIDFNRFATPEVFLPKCANVVITKIPHDAANFADKLLDRIFNSDIIVSDFSMTTDMPSTMNESAVRSII